MMLELFLNALLVIFISVSLLWLLSVYLKNASIVDLFWGLAYVMVNAVYFYKSGEPDNRKILLLILVSLWGFRLFIYLSWRNIGQPEDFRYQEFRRGYGPKRYWWVSYFQTFLLQGALVMLISLPLLGVHSSTSNAELNAIDILALVVFVIGFIFEAGGDYQLSKFKKDPLNQSKVLDSGLWKYTRHPNYFGDAAVWWSFGLFSIAAGSYWPIIGSIFMTLLIIKVSGVAMLEKSLKKSKPKYHEYIRKTNAFFPWFPKK